MDTCEGRPEPGATTVDGPRRTHVRVRRHRRHGPPDPSTWRYLHPHRPAIERRIPLRHLLWTRCLAPDMELRQDPVCLRRGVVRCACARVCTCEASRETLCGRCSHHVRPLQSSCAATLHTRCSRRLVSSPAQGALCHDHYLLCSDHCMHYCMHYVEPGVYVPSAQSFLDQVYIDVTN